MKQPCPVCHKYRQLSTDITEFDGYKVIVERALCVSCKTRSVKKTWLFSPAVRDLPLVWDDPLNTLEDDGEEYPPIPY